MNIPTMWLTCGDVNFIRNGHFLHGEDETGQHWLLTVKESDDCYCGADRLVAQLPTSDKELNKILIAK